MKDFDRVFLEFKQMVFAEIEPLHGKIQAGMCMLAFENEKEFFELFYKAGAESTSKWISVEEKLPVNAQTVFASGFDWGDKNNKRHFVVCEYFDNTWVGERDEEFIYITHWTAIPELGELT